MKILELTGPVELGPYDAMQVNGLGIWGLLNDLVRYLERTGRPARLTLTVETQAPEPPARPAGEERPEEVRHEPD